MHKNFNLILALLFLYIQGCGLFDTRDAEPPSEQRSTFSQPTSADIVISNLNFAIAEKNLDNYMRCFVDSNFSNRRFKYFPDALSQSQYAVFLTWGLFNERNYFSNLISLTDPSAFPGLRLFNTTFIAGIDSTIVDSEYVLRFDHNRPNVAKETRGKLRFILSTDFRSLWSIHNWYDFIDDNNDTTWSVLKANFVN